MILDAETAAGFARMTLDHLGLRYPYKLDLVLTGPDDLIEPAALHPIFHGSFDWHSCVHGWWQVMRIARLFPDLAEAAEIRDLADAMLVPDKVAGEVARLDRPYSATFERPYGWAWALALHAELARHDTPRWADALAPLAERFADLFKRYLAKLEYPVRTGTHYNSAFAMVLAHGWANKRDPALAAAIAERTEVWFGEDRACQAWEPGGDDFLSPALIEALAMATVLPPGRFRDWFDAFLPDAGGGSPQTLFAPVRVTDRSDGKIAHLDGVNLSRAWCWRRLAAVLGADHPVRPRALATAEDHLTASLPHIGEDYMGSHWLASFALLALEAKPQEVPGKDGR